MGGRSLDHSSMPCQVQGGPKSSWLIVPSQCCVCLNPLKVSPTACPENLALSYHVTSRGPLGAPSQLQLRCGNRREWKILACALFSQNKRVFSHLFSEQVAKAHCIAERKRVLITEFRCNICNTFLERKAAEFAHEQCYHLGPVLCRAKGKFRCRSRKDHANSLMELAWTSVSEGKSLCWREAELFQERGGVQDTTVFNSGGKLETAVGDGCTHSPAIISCPACASHFSVL